MKHNNQHSQASQTKSRIGFSRKVFGGPKGGFPKLTKMTVRTIWDTSTPTFQYQAPDPSIFFDLGARSSSDTSDPSLGEDSDHGTDSDDTMGGSSSKATSTSHSHFRYAATNPDILGIPDEIPMFEKQDYGPEYVLTSISYKLFFMLCSWGSRLVI